MVTYTPTLSEAELNKIVAALDMATKHVAAQVTQEGAGLNAAVEAGAMLVELYELAAKLRASAVEVEEPS